LTGDYRYINEMVIFSRIGNDLNKSLSGYIYIYGAGKRGKSLIDMFPDKNWKGFIDSKKEGKYRGYSIIPLKKFVYEEDSKILISNKEKYDEIYNELICMGVPHNKIICYQEYWMRACNNIYFDSSVLKNVTILRGTMLDIGCYDGSDSIRAINKMGGQISDIIALEPDKKNYEQCKINLAGYENILLINKGIAERAESLYFKEGGGMGARVLEEGDIRIEVDSIDNVVNNRSISMIKMDIEGYEENALIGGVNTILKYKPVLAVSVYHKSTDIWRLPLKILEINPNYTLYMRHYTLNDGDTVLYAVDESKCS
jgi:FkbM family methyltransferase